ncbi:MAG: ribonuclease, partial [Verrucomicrobia bacterium]|nr:ribonuclease [Deltaproteobacteria bacterium]
MRLTAVARSVSLILFACFCLLQQAQAESCEKAVHELNSRISPGIDEQELVEILRSLNSTNNKRLPPKFVTKQQARYQGWKPGKDLWSVRTLKGSSMGGDRFQNREGRLPDSKWREADLDYKGGRRGGKRLVF